MTRKELRNYRTLWGNTISLAKYLPYLKKEGFYGIEAGLGSNWCLSDDDKLALPALLCSNSLDLILTVQTIGLNSRTDNLSVSILFDINN